MAGWRTPTCLLGATTRCPQKGPGEAEVLKKHVVSRLAEDAIFVVTTAGYKEYACVFG